MCYVLGYVMPDVNIRKNQTYDDKSGKRDTKTKVPIGVNISVLKLIAESNKCSVHYCSIFFFLYPTIVTCVIEVNSVICINSLDTPHES